MRMVSIFGQGERPEWLWALQARRRPARGRCPAARVLLSGRARPL